MNVRFSKAEVSMMRKIIAGEPWIKDPVYSLQRAVISKLEVIEKSLLDGESVSLKVSHAGPA